jgi:hypothetical protein
MRPILRDIRAVAGVTGVAVIVKQDGHVESLFPAAFTQQHTEELLKLITAAYQRLRGFNWLSLRFERVVVHLLNQPEFLLFATVLPDIDEHLFETIVKSKLPSIGRELSRENERGRGERAGSTKSQAQPERAVSVLIQACNALAHILGDKVSLTGVASAWRQARGTATSDNDALAALEVDAGGKLNILKGRVLPPSADSMKAIAEMVQRFFTSLGTAGTTAEGAFYALLEPHRHMLEEYGFYYFMREAAGPANSRRSRHAASAN